MKFVSTLLLFLICAFHCHLEARTIHVVGDSHAGEFERLPHCAVYKLNGGTMYRVGNMPLDIGTLGDFRGEFANTSIPLQEDDAIIFAFGQVDVDHHILKQHIRFGRKVDEIIATLALKYVSAIYLNLLKYPNCIKIIYNVVPPTDLGWNPHDPCWGNLSERIDITKKLNHLLSTLAPLFGFEFLDVYNDYANPDGSLNRDLSDGSVHLNPTYDGAIRRELYRILSKYEKPPSCQI